MPFDPLQTDEPTKKAYPREKDLDTQMLGGCSAFTLSAFLTYGLGIWPFFAIKNLTTWNGLLTATGLGALTSLIFIWAASRTAGISGWFGGMGGTLAIIVFEYLLVNHVIDLSRGPEQPPIEFGPLVPVGLGFGWFFVAVLVGYVGHRKSRSQL